MKEQQKRKIVITDVVPMGTVRMIRRGGKMGEPARRYMAYKNYLQTCIAMQDKQEPLKGKVAVNVIFHMPIPQSWSKKKQLESVGKFHNKKPDIDNIIKGLFDAINGICWKDDNQVGRLTASKVYSDNPRIEFEVIEIV